MRAIGIFCGTFNPIHLGHLLIAECARDQFKLEKVIFVTSPRPPHRKDVLLDASLRHQMVALAVCDNPYFDASDVEIERPGLSYTVDTLKHFRAVYKRDVELKLLIGADNINQLSSWHKINEIRSIAKLLVARRTTPDEVEKTGQALVTTGEFEEINSPCVDISSSAIRKRISQGESILYMVPPAVNTMLLKTSCYRT